MNFSRFILAGVLALLCTPKAHAAETQIPWGAWDYCERYHDDMCGPAQAREAMPWSGDRRRELEDINGRVNHLILFQDDMSMHGVPEYWEKNATRGDCEEYALRKYEELRALGWSEKSLDIGVVTPSAQRFHAVLIAHTSEGDWVLDYYFDHAVAKTEYPYPFTKWSKGSLLHWESAE